MKALYFTLIFGFIALFSLSAEAYPPEGWTDDVLEAMAESEKTGKDILLNFTGSDWCVWCKKLKAEVFETAAFREYAEKNLVLLFLDFPNGIDQSEELKKQNEVMAGLFGVQGFPTIWLMDSTQLPLMKTGYQDGGPEKYIRHLENDRPEFSEDAKEKNREIVGDTIREHLGEW